MRLTFINKGGSADPEYRSRLVATEINMDSRDDFVCCYSTTRGIEATTELGNDGGIRK